MTRLPRITAIDLLRSLKRDGWQEVRQEGSHVQLKHPSPLGHANAVAPSLWYAVVNRGELGSVILVDSVRTYSSGPRGLKHWCHMATNDPTPAGMEDLVRFAVELGLRPEWIHRRPGLPHFDLPPDVREVAIEKGAVAVTSRELVRSCRKVP